MSIYYFGVTFYLLSLDLYLVVRADGMVGAGVWYVPTLGACALILRFTLGGA